MGKRIEKQEIINVSIEDDFDGTELDPDTKPLVVKLDGTDYTLYLSDSNKAEVQALLKKIRKGETAKPQRQNRTEQFGHDYQEVREWATTNGLIAGPGRVSQAVYLAYDLHTAGEDWKAISKLSSAQVKKAVAERLEQR